MGNAQFYNRQDISGQTLSNVSTTAEITANTANQLDEDLQAVDVSAGYDTGEDNISGAQEIAIAATSGDGNSFSVTVEWTDGAGNVLFSESPSSLQTTTDGGANLIVKSTHVRVKFSGTSTSVTGTVNAH